MKTLYTILFVTLLSYTSTAQETKNEMNIDLVSLYMSPTSKNAESTAYNFYPLSGISYSRHLSKFSLFTSYHRYTSTTRSIARFHQNLGEERSRSHKESVFELGMAIKKSVDNRFVPLLAVSIIGGLAETKNYENDRYHEWYFYGKPAYRNISYLGLNGLLGIRYNINGLFHLNLNTKLGFVKTTGTYQVIEKINGNPKLFEYNERAIVPMFTIAELAVGVNF